MGLAKRVIPTLLLDHGKLVKGKKFSADRCIGNPFQAVQVFNLREADELVVFDVSASRENRPPDFHTIEKMCARNFVPITVGGGIKSVEQAKILVRDCGVDKVALGSSALRQEGLAEAIAALFGRQAVVGVVRSDVDYSSLPAVGEIIVQSVEHDGMMDGYDFHAISRWASSVDCPVVASSGCGSYVDMDSALHAGADAVAAGALWQFTEATPRKAKEYLGAQGWEVR